MKIDEIRLQNLNILLEEAVTAKKLATKSKTSSAYISQVKLRKINSNTGKPRNVGDGLARKLEKGMNKHEGWMDQAHPELNNAVNENSANYELSDKAKQLYFDFEQLAPNDKARLFSILAEKAFSTS